ncbi:MAG: M20/M25/M40 family metallo-hydrolase [Kiritimatiellae bacterium]|nr:M20/M25/M40 family metallo-hydrolase [Kiritimatiellia bacterium]
MKEEMPARPNSSDLSEYFELLRFETVGAEPMRLRDCVQCATWLKKWLEKTGAEARLVLPPRGSDFASVGCPPVVFAERKGDPGAPTVLVYGHYDVQPPDPLDAWNSPPFEPVEKDGRVYGRGSQDDKGQLFSFLCGLRRFLQNAKGPVPTLKFVYEGQEESGSGALTRLLTERASDDPEAPGFREGLAADVLCVCDTGAAADLRPAIVAGLRGVTHFTLRLEGANRDLHSGSFGGVAPNAAQAMAELLASLHNPDGSIAVRGFMDGVAEPSAEELAAARDSALSDEACEREIGCPPTGGERALPPVVRNSFRPTIEVNGVHSGYGGPGSKTVIPCAALAKLSMRLVPNQNPKDAMAAVERHLKLHSPPGMKLFVEDVTGEAPALKLPLSSPVFRLAAAVLEEIDSRGAVFQWDGASIPVVSLLARVSGAAPLLVGFGQPSDCIHSPNESFSLRQFALGSAWAEKILGAL